MMKPIPGRRAQPSSEDGYILVWVMFLVAVFTIWLAVAIPDAAKEIRRDREVETMQRGKQYIRAVQLYYRRFHAYPPTKDALVNTNQIRFLRKNYLDPITRKDDWKPILFGQAKTQTLGFFGQPLAGAGSAGGSMLAGIGPGGNGGFGGNSIGGPMGSGGSSIGGPGLGTSSIFASGDNGTGQNGSTPSGTGTGGIGTSGTGTSSAGTSGTTPSAGGSNGNSSDPAMSPQTFGGAGIVGFSPATAKQSILVYKKKNHYNEWEFIYDPLADMRTIAGNTGQVGQPATSTTNQIGSPGFGTSSNSGFGSSNAGSSSPGSSSSTNPAPPQQ